jgi:hypothetical protein
MFGGLIPQQQQQRKPQGGMGGLLNGDYSPILLSLAQGLLSPGNDLGAGIGAGLQQAAPYVQSLAERRKQLDAVRAMAGAGGMNEEQNTFLQQFPHLAPQVLSQRLFPEAPPQITPYQQQQLDLQRQNQEGDAAYRQQTLEQQGSQQQQESEYRRQQAEQRAAEQRYQFDNGALYDMQGEGGPKMLQPGPGAGGKQPNEYQMKAAGLADRMREADQVLTDQAQLDEAGNPKGYVPNGFGAAAGNMILGPDSYFNSGDYRQFISASRQWISGLLRKDSGGAITEEEFAKEFPTYFPQPGDTPDVLLTKKQRRAQAAKRMAAEAGTGWDSLQSRLGAGAAATPPSRDDLAKKYGLDTGVQ